jgi:hypothetical protein
MNVFMLREILYRETYDKSHSVYTENPGKGGGGKEIHENARPENPPNCALVRLSWAEAFEVPPTHTYNGYNVIVYGGCFPTNLLTISISID